VVIDAPLPKDSAEEELPAHRERAEPLLEDQGVVVGVVPLLIVGVTVTVGIGRPEIGADRPFEVVGKPVAVAVRLGRVASLLEIGPAVRVDDHLPGLVAVGEPVPIGVDRIRVGQMPVPEPVAIPVLLVVVRQAVTVAVNGA